MVEEEGVGREGVTRESQLPHPEEAGFKVEAFEAKAEVEGAIIGWESPTSAPPVASESTTPVTDPKTLPSSLATLVSPTAAAHPLPSPGAP